MKYAPEEHRQMQEALRMHEGKIVDTVVLDADGEGTKFTFFGGGTYWHRNAFTEAEQRLYRAEEIIRNILHDVSGSYVAAEEFLEEAE
jgi:hypothetical protein